MARLVRLPVGARKVSHAHGAPLVFLGKEYRWLVGKRVYVEILAELDEAEGGS